MELPSDLASMSLIGEDKFHNILLAPLMGNTNMSGLVSSNNVNSGLMLGEDGDVDVDQYKLSYQNIVDNEIGTDNI
jgi:hypothetical protein